MCPKDEDGVAISEQCTLMSIQGNVMIWLVIETACFYCYMFATVVYIAGIMIQRSCQRTKQFSDYKKAIKDFISYA